MTEAERKKILFEWNDTDVLFPENMTLHEVFEEQVKVTPHNIAVLCEGNSLTYRELNERANRLGNAIRGYYRTIYREDILPDFPIGICMNRGIGMIVAILGILKSGCAYMPIDPSYPPDRLRFMMDDALAPLVITEMALLEKLLFLNEADYGIISLDGGWKVIEKYSDKNPEAINGPDNLAYIIYTSGSTGKPKGAMIEHRSAVNFAFNEKKKRQINPGDRVLQFSSINFDASVADIYPALLSGATLCIAHDEIRKDPEELLRYIKELSVNSMVITPVVLHAMPKEDVPSLKSLSVGGDVCDGETLKFWSRGRILINIYGPTECTVSSNECIYREDSLYNEIGGPIDNMKSYILDSNLNPVPVDVPGELYIGGIGVGRGYLNRPSLTEERFIPNPFVTEEERAGGRNLRLYRTGDRVKWLKNGSVEFLGRVDFQVKIRGFRIEPGEIEAILSSHGEVKDCAVAPYEDGKEKHLAAYYIPVTGTSPSPESLRSHLEEILPDYMIPSVFVKMDSLPLSPSHKIDRKALPPPGRDIIIAQMKRTSVYIGPKSQEEKDVSDIITKILNLEKISIDNDIFDLGVHSLMAAQIASEIRKKFSKKIELKDIFQHRTIKNIADFICKKTAGEKEEIISITKVPHRKNIPLSFQQEQVWFLSKLVPNNRAYNFQFLIRIKGKLDKDILTKCLNEIIRRHEILRTTFHESSGGPIQIVHSPWKAIISEIDLIDFPEDKREEEAEKLIDNVIAQSFDFGKLPLVKWNLYKLGEEDYMFLHMEHHFLHDGWEAAIFLREIKALYCAYKDGKDSPLEELPVQYADYAVWQRNYLSGDRLLEKVNYWVNKIKDYPQVLNIPADHPRPSVQTFNGGVIRVDMKKSLYHSLREFSRANKVTLFNTLYSAFAVLISKYTRQAKFLIGTGVANRNSREVECLMGMFVNTVLLYSDLTDNPSFKNFMRRTKECMVYDSVHYDTPFMYIVEKLKAGNVPGRNPLFQVLFAFHDSAVPLLNFADIHGKLLEKHNATAKTDINVICIPRAEQHVSQREVAAEEEDLTVLWEYNSDLFDRETMERMVEHYLALLEQILTSPEKKVNDIDILVEKEKEKILYHFNDNSVDYDRKGTIKTIFEEQVKIRPEKIAIIHNKKKFSYRELNEEANRIARRLKPLLGNSTPGAPVGICVERSIDMIAGILGILKGGCSYVPLPPNYPENRLDFIIEDAGINVILTHDKFKREVPCLSREGRIVLSLDKERNDDFDGNPCNISGPEDIAYIIYTSGSTGNPKGVSITHGAVNNFVTSMRKDVISENDIVAQCANYAFDATVYEFWGTLLTGATLVIIDTNKIENLDMLKEEILDNNITSAFFTTSLFNAIADCELDIFFPLRSVLFGGEAVNVSCVKKLLRAKPETLNVFHCYGPTECTCYSTYCLLTDKYKESDIIPIGKPLHNYTAYVVDESRIPLPVGVPGELYIGGDSLAKGYINRPELTKERFIENPFVTEDDKKNGRNTRLYKTGDLVLWLPDGNIEFLGRTDFQVKIRGFRIEPEEIEAVLLKHNDVKQCAVLPWEQHLIAYWVPEDGSSDISQEDLKSFLCSYLPEFMIPAVFIRMEAFKLNNNFKVDRSRLPLPKLEDIIISKREYVPPGTMTEEILAGIWKDLLKIDKISINDNFFELGGNSILTVRMLSSVKRKLGADVNISQMFARPTIAFLGAHIDGTGITSGIVEDNLSIALMDGETEIEVKNTLPGNFKEPSAVLLTGVTGFLGIYLLDTIISETEADVYCLLRGDNTGELSERFNNNISFYRKEHLRNNPRVKLLNGDLEKSNLGLEAETLDMLKNTLDSIYHCGAYVHHMYDYNRLKKSNVDSVIELLNIAASGKKKTFNFISTLGSASIRNREGNLVEIDPEDMPVSTNGYMLSKWVAEKIVAGASLKGMDCNIFRPGNITGDSINGICPPEKNHSLLLLKGCIQMTAAPDWKRSMEMAPVDVLSRSIVKLSQNFTGFNIYNMNNPFEISWYDYINLIKDNGFDVNLVPVNIWKEKYLMMIDERNAMFTIKEFYIKERRDIMSRKWKSFSRWNSGEVQAKLKELGIFYPDCYNDYVKIITKYLVESGFLSV